MQPPFLLFSKNSRFIRGETEHYETSQPRYISLILFVLMFIGGLIGIFYASYSTYQVYQDKQELNNSGVQTVAQIIGREFRNDSEGGNYYLMVRYQIDGQFYSRELVISKSTYERTQISQNITIIYAPDDPNNIRLKGDQQNENTVLILGGLIFLVALILVWTGGSSAYASAREIDHRAVLDKKGQVIMGEIVESTGYENEGRFHLRIRYQFQSPISGTLITHREEGVRNEYKQKTLPRIGTPVCIYYATDEIYRLL